MRQKVFALLLIVLLPLLAVAQQGGNIYDQLDLNYKGLESVREAYQRGDIEASDALLLQYFRTRQGVELYGFNPQKVTISAEEQKWADESLEHKFYAHKGYQPSYFYGEDIDWRYWPVKDNELRWQLHRHYWFIPLAKAHYIGGDDKYAQAWVDQYSDWVIKNPLTDLKALKAVGASEEEIAAERENLSFAWRPMEASRRLQDQLMVFSLLKDAECITPQFFNMFLSMYHLHADYTCHNYSDKGNHLIFEAQRMLYAGLFFPEFKDAKGWREQAIKILNEQIDEQVYDDGVQFELDYGYHIAAINIFLKALRMAQVNDLEGEFPQSFVNKIELMTEFVYNVMFPDYTNPMYGDTKLHSGSTIQRNFKDWAQAFPHNEQIKWFATKGAEGEKPQYRAKEFPLGGYYSMRSDWGAKRTVMALVKAGPPAFWHNQPDNGSFHYWRNGRDFFSDSGCYVYGGDAEVLAQRDWFRQTRVHNTLTLDERNLENTDSKCLLWHQEPNLVTLVTENQSYSDLKHRRSFFFVNSEVLVVVDQVSGSAKGTIGVNFQLSPTEIEIFPNDVRVRTLYEDGNNVIIKSASPSKLKIVEKEGWISYGYREKQERPSYAVEAQKRTDKDMIIVSVVVPSMKKYRGKIEVEIADSTFDEQMDIVVKLGENRFELGYEL